MAKNHGVTVLLPDVRLRFAYLAAPYEGKDDEGKTKYSHSATPLFKAGSPAHVAIKKAIQDTAASGWGANAAAVLTQLAAQDRLCIHDGNVSKADKIAAGDDSWKDMLYVSANAKASGPQDAMMCVVTESGINKHINSSHPLYPYAGCWANVLIRVYPQHPDDQPVAKNGKSYGKRVNAELLSVQFLRHDESFGGRSKVVAPEEFPVVQTGGADAPAPSAAAAGGLI